MENQRYVHNRPPFCRKDITAKNFVSHEASRNIYPCFQLAKLVVAKTKEIETKKNKTVLVVDDEPLTFDLIEELFH
jgi:hypothetical protein